MTPESCNVLEPHVQRRVSMPCQEYTMTSQHRGCTLWLLSNIAKHKLHSPWPAPVLVAAYASPMHSFVSGRSGWSVPVLIVVGASFTALMMQSGRVVVATFPAMSTTIETMMHEARCEATYHHHVPPTTSNLLSRHIDDPFHNLGSFHSVDQSRGFCGDCDSVECESNSFN